MSEGGERCERDKVMDLFEGIHDRAAGQNNNQTRSRASPNRNDIRRKENAALGLVCFAAHGDWGGVRNVVVLVVRTCTTESLSIDQQQQQTTKKSRSLWTKDEL